jgi:putative phosphoribosyl transferase
VAGDGRFLDGDMIRAAEISPDDIARITEATRQLLEQRASLFRGGRPQLPITNRTAILVDDGIATGASIFAAAQALKQMRPRKLIIAVPVVPCSTRERLEREVDEFLALQSPEDFQAVGQFYRDFRQTSDQEVIDLLRRANERHDRPDISPQA